MPAIITIRASSKGVTRTHLTLREAATTEEDIKTTLEVTQVVTDSKTITKETTQVAILLDLMLWVVVDLQRMDKRRMSLR